MDSFDWNRLAASLVLSGCVLLGAWKIGDIMIRGNPPIKPSFSVGDQQDENIDISKGNIVLGKEAAFKACGMCHTFNKNEMNKIGPNLYDIMGQTIASKDNFIYSQSLQKHHKEHWTIQNMNEWLINPMIFAPSTIMAYPGVQQQQDRMNIIAYLNSISSSKILKKQTVQQNVEQAKKTDTNIIPLKDNKPDNSKQFLYKGEQAFKLYCSVCHKVTVNGNTAIGPNLYDIVNKPIASKNNYNYSKALKTKKDNWTEKNLDQYIQDPTKWVVGTKMTYTGTTSHEIMSPEIRKDIILYLKSFSLTTSHP